MNPEELRALLVCPTCRQGELEGWPGPLRCAACGASYPVDDGVPLLLAPGVAQHSLRQAEHYDHETDAEYETVRPFGTPRFHRALLEEKFRRSVNRLGTPLPAPALVVCGGSGMDAHLLARSGVSTITSDVSLGAAKRARDRAERYGLPVLSIVAAVERLPFADASIPLVYVHDGLHHLEHPGAGLSEMARVARSAVSVSEPARAAVTAAAIRVGLALEREDAGNRVARLRLADVVTPLREAGFRVVAASRYAMLYRHEPGLPSRALSAPLVFPTARLALAVANRLGGRAGNKLAVQAVRDR